MDFWTGLLVGAMLGCILGCIIGAIYTGRARRYWQWRLARKLQLIAARNEMKGYRHQRRRPVLKNWRKALLGWLHSITPTYNPSSDWVAQQIRDAYPFDEAPKLMLMDHDSIFVPVMNKTLPNMGIKVVRTSVGCPKQNGVVERFNRTLTEELLNHIIPLGAQHISPGSVACTTVTAGLRNPISLSWTSATTAEE